MIKLNIPQVGPCSLEDGPYYGLPDTKFFIGIGIGNQQAIATYHPVTDIYLLCDDEDHSLLEIVSKRKY